MSGGEDKREVTFHLRLGSPGRLALLGRDEEGHLHFRLEVPPPLPVAARMLAAWSQILAPGRARVLLPDGKEAPAAPPLPETAEAAGSEDVRRVLYHCFGGAHTSVVAGALHLGLLPARPHWRQIASLPHFDRTTHRERGWPLFLGTDERGRQVFAMGRGRHGPAMMRAFTALLQALGLDGKAVATYDTLRCAGPFTKLGGYMSRRLGLVRAGRTLAAWGVGRDLPRLRVVVERARQDPSLNPDPSA